ncbi:unnamed protein product [Larinioides sclopetarius]|uniref:NUDIX hydrolase n=1 Tax=Larinioides sclopetarius TaxID=280406 RepID=A0AAV2AT30_9ARAC
MKTSDLTPTKHCSMCCKHFQSSFFMNLDECGHIVCKVCLYDKINKTENQTCPVCKSFISEKQIDIIHSCMMHTDDHLDNACYEKVYQSSGGILVRRVNDTLYYLAIQQRRRNGDLQWVSPKGQIEGNENSLETAKREISEEIGLKSITLIDFISKQCFSYRESGKLYKKTIFWYLFNVDQPSELVLNHEEGFFMSKWLTYEESISVFSHESFIELIKVVDNILNKS